MFLLLNRKRKPVVELFLWEELFKQELVDSICQHFDKWKKKRRVKRTLSFPYNKRSKRLVCFGNKRAQIQIFTLKFTVVCWTGRSTTVFSHLILEFFLQIKLNMFKGRLSDCHLVSLHKLFKLLLVNYFLVQLLGHHEKIRELILKNPPASTCISLEILF